MYLYWEIAFFNLSQPSPHAVTLIGGSLDAVSISYCDWVHFQFYYRHGIKISGKVLYMHKEREGLSYLPCFSKYQIKHILHALRFSKFLILKSVSVYLSGRFISPSPSELCIYVLWDNKERRTAKSRNVWIVLYNIINYLFVLPILHENGYNCTSRVYIGIFIAKHASYVSAHLYKYPL